MARKGHFNNRCSRTGGRLISLTARQAAIKNGCQEYKKAVKKARKVAIATTGAIWRKPIAKHKHA